MPLRALLVCVALLLSGCAGREAVSPAVLAASSSADAGQWSVGAWWSYRVELGAETFDVTVVVDEVRRDGFHLGSNLSAGFFGLPWNGNLTAARNPVVAGEEWPLYRFPLAHGAEWSYRMRGHDATARASAVEGGFSLEAQSWGRTFARYDFLDAVGWFSRFELVEPTDGSVLLRASLLDHGAAYEGAYFVERTLVERAVVDPVLPGALALPVPPGAQHLRAFVTAEVAAGALRAELRDESDRPLARVVAAGRGGASDTAIVRAAEGGVWTLHHAGVAMGVVRVEITGVFEA